MLLLPKAGWWESLPTDGTGGVFLELAELDAVGYAQVVAVEPCPAIASGPGRVVMGTFHHSAGDVYDVRLSDGSQLGVTGRHPVWSVDREDWVSVGDLEPGETLETLHGTVQFESATLQAEAAPVFNLEVDADHAYRVGEHGVLVHNESGAASPCGPATDACKDYTYQDTAPSGYSSWTDYVVKKCKGSTSGVTNPHGHHIVMKGDRFPENAQARAILCKYKINPFTDCCNLTVSRNWCHSKRYAEHVLEELQKADAKGATKGEICRVLKGLADWHRRCPDPGEVNPEHDEA